MFVMVITVMGLICFEIAINRGWLKVKRNHPTLFPATTPHCHCTLGMEILLILGVGTLAPHQTPPHFHICWHLVSCFFISFKLFLTWHWLNLHRWGTLSIIMLASVFCKLDTWSRSLCSPCTFCVPRDRRVRGPPWLEIRRNTGHWSSSDTSETEY